MFTRRLNGSSALVGPAQDPEPGVHVARVYEAGGVVDGDAPDLGHLREDTALSRLDRVLSRGWHEVRDLGRVRWVSGVDDTHTVGVPRGVDVGSNDERVVDRVVTRALRA